MRSAIVGVLFFVALTSRASAGPPPRLAVIVVVDQLGMMQLDRYEDLLGNDGIRRLLEGGAVARDARYLGAPTVTAHGHATLSTGAYGDRHGIVGNEWWERGVGLVHVCHDPAYKLLTRATQEKDGTAPTQLRVPTFADALRMSRPGARVVSLSLKDRGAILFGGASPQAVVWYDVESDRWTTSTYYGDHLPSWVPAGAVSGAAKSWGPLADPKLYAHRAGPSDTTGFPHVLAAPSDANRGKTFIGTPLADEALFDLAIRALDAEHLGEDDVPDLLTISASAFDYVGHDYGSESQEALDAVLREDAGVARLLSALDAKLGKGNYVIALSADHGVRPTPKRAMRERAYAGVMDPKALVASAEAALDARIGGHDQLTRIVNTGISYQDASLSGAVRPEDEARVIDALKKSPGIRDVFPRSLFVSHLALGGDAAFYARSYFDGRSPDFILEPFVGWAWEDVATHEAPYLSELRVPFVIYRSGREPMSIDGMVDAASLTPTLALILGSAPPAGAEAPILTRVVERLR